MVKRRVLKYSDEYGIPVEALWAIISDTERLNQAGKTPFTPYLVEEKLDDAGSVIRHASKRIGPITLRWRERFGEWLDGRFLSQARHFDTGPFRVLAVALTVSPTASGSRLDARFTAVWAGWFGSLLSGIGALPLICTPLMNTVKQLAADAAKDGPPESSVAYQPPAPDDALRSRLDQSVQRMETSDYAHGLGRRLGDYLLQANPLDLRRLRPLQMACDWGEQPARMVELFLAAHKAGLLSMRWEIMCPRCRGGKSTAGTLSDLAQSVHCESCQIDYDRDFENNVELVFSPEPWLRTLPDASFCMMGPASMPHVRVQCEVPPGATREELADLAPGRYRLRTIEPGGETVHEHQGGPFPEIVVTDDGVAAGEIGEEGTVAMANYGTGPRTVVVESTAWSDVALTGPKVIASQAFRTLCPEQLLRPGDDVAIGRVAILFSDLSGSTALYERIGDTRAFALVREHFDFMEDRVRRHGGAVVKTIGDAVMAVFPDDPDAVAAAVAMQGDVAGFNAERPEGGVELKIGVHAGPCIAVTSDGVLDYFGSNVNIAARIQGLCRGGEIVLSDRLMANPAVRAAVADRVLSTETTRLQGIGGETVIHRVTIG